jgi:pimeloyl-ACP methyl ester carboxylesterase
MLGYSMGGAIAQEFVRQFPERVVRLILCATMAGGPGARYARSSVVRVMRDLDGLSPEQAARRIWTVTYSPGYLERRRELAEQQMLREIAQPTPLHAADLQFQAFAEFDGSKALSDIPCPTLVLTGEHDELILAQNSRMIAKIIPDAKLIVISGGGHRVLWEATPGCVDLIAEFLTCEDVSHPRENRARTQALSGLLPSTFESFVTWPFALAKAAFDSFTFVWQSAMLRSPSRYGDGKPIVLVPGFPGTDIPLIPFALWLKEFGYRPVIASPYLDAQDSSVDRVLPQTIGDITRRVGRKAVLIAGSPGMTRALRAAEAHRDCISDVIIFQTSHRPNTANLSVHLLSSHWSPLQIMIGLPQLLRSIRIELIEESEDTPPQQIAQT